MAKVSISNLIGGGLNSDINPVDMGENFLTYCNNVRMKSGGITPFGGYASSANIAAGKKAHHMKFLRGVNDDAWIIACEDDVLSYSTSFTSIKPDSMPAITHEDGWNITSISGILIVNHPALGPCFMDGASSKLIPLPWKVGQDWSVAKQKCDVIAVHRQFMFAMGIYDNGKYSADGIRWSAPADVGAVPKNWDPLDTTSTAGVMSLGGSGGRIVGGLSMRDSFAVYREYGITMFDYIGGVYVWRARNLESDVGLISKDSVVDVNGTHYFISYGDIYTNDGNSITSIATDRVTSILNGIDKHNYKKSFAMHDSSAKEVWFCFPGVGHDSSNKCLIYNYEYNSWTPRDVPDICCADVGLITSDDSIWDNSNEEWDSSARSWNDNANSPYDTVVMGLRKIDATNYQIVVLDIPLGFNSSPYSSIIERTDLPLGGVDVTNTITRVYPHVTGASKLSIQLGSQMMPGGPVLWKQPVDFYPNKDRKVDVRTTGLLHAYRILATDVTSNFILTGIDFEYTETGRR